jgi:hypothetical protein
MMDKTEQIRRHANWIQQLTESLELHSVASHGNLFGCSDEEILRVQQQFAFELPNAYRLFLATMGKGAGKFFVGTDLFFPSILGVTDDARELVSEDSAEITLPDNAIVFAMHQGYQFMFMLADGSDDPPVVSYLERSGKFDKQSESFSQYLLSASNDSW